MIGDLFKYPQPEERVIAAQQSLVAIRCIHLLKIGLLNDGLDVHRGFETFFRWVELSKVKRRGIEGKRSHGTGSMRPETSYLHHWIRISRTRLV